MEVSGQLHTLATLFPGKELLVPLGQEAGWAPRTGMNAVAKRKIPITAPARN